MPANDENYIQFFTAVYSSAKYYYNRNDPFQLLKHYADI